MAYMNQEKKAIIAAAMKPVLKKYNMKGSLSVRSHLSICLTVKSGSIDFDLKDKGYGYQVNTYWIKDHWTGKAQAFLLEALNAMKSAGYYNNTDASIDYFDTAYYMDINIGKWNKPYILETV
jgi:hypothetical protein